MSVSGIMASEPRLVKRIGLRPHFIPLATGTTYNTLGQKTSITYPDGASYTYTYDANNQLNTVNFPTGFGSITINSYQWTVPSQITLPGGTQRNQQYDGLLRLKTFDVKDPGQSQVMSYQYGYDLTNNIIAKATEAGTTNYGYDTLDRLTNAAYTGSSQTNETYTYDPVANRTTDSKTAAATWTYNENNQILSAGSISYTYDDNGNTTNQTDANNPANTRNYVYDIDNRLIEVRDGTNTLIARYSYDPFGRRLSKTVTTGATSTTQYFLYNEEGLISEADATGQITKSYGYAPGSTFSTNPLWMKTGNAYYTYQNDHLGTPQKLLNQSGQVVWSAAYDAFGKATVNPASTVTNNLRFPGQHEDAETGLHYNWNRYYDPTTGRYTTSDPISLDGGINMYTYVEGNPVGNIDPNGEFVFVIPIMINAGIGFATDLLYQSIVQGRSLECLNLKSALFAAGASALFTGAVMGGGRLLMRPSGYRLGQATIFKQGVQKGGYVNHQVFRSGPDPNFRIEWATRPNRWGMPHFHPFNPDIHPVIPPISGLPIGAGVASKSECQCNTR